MKPICLRNINLTGEAGYRVIKSYSRLEDVFYRPESLFGEYNYEWPGDWEGRTLLALTLLEDMTGRKAAYYDAIFDRIQKEKNALGYMMQILPQGQANEQQLSGHNWLLRALIERYLRMQDTAAKKMAEDIVRNLYLPLKDQYACYPVSPEQRTLQGGVAGHQAGEAVNGWYLSTDIGCAYMSLDALGQYYSVFGDEDVSALLDAMISSFCKINLKETSMQTHATLSATRGILYYYEATRRPELLTLAKELFAYYKAHGMTENYANYNWFGRPWWTEPCAIVDSYLVAIRLFQFTKDWAYADMASRIFFNAMRSAQRDNGGFGCDTCAGAEENGTVMKVKADIYEAFFCCSMRGAEGLTASAAYSILEDEKTVYFTNYLPGTYIGANAIYKVSGGYPYDGSIRIEISENWDDTEVQLYIPSHTSEHRVTWNGHQIEANVGQNMLCTGISGSGILEVTFCIETDWEPCACDQTPEGYESCWYGILQLGKLIHEEKAPLGFRQYEQENGAFIPLCDRMYYKKALFEGVEIIRKTNK